MHVNGVHKPIASPLRLPQRSPKYLTRPKAIDMGSVGSSTASASAVGDSPMSMTSLAALVAHEPEDEERAEQERVKALKQTGTLMPPGVGMSPTMSPVRTPLTPTTAGAPVGKVS